MSKPRVNPRDQLLLWTRAAGICSHPGCRKRLVLDATASDPAATIGEAAHIVARAGAGPRGAAPIDPAARNRYPNLILLCANHHTTIDLQPETYTVDLLRDWKARHEAWVESLTAESPAPAEPWTAIVHEGAHWIYLPDLADALGPARRIAGTLELRHLLNPAATSVLAAREYRAVRTALALTPSERRRFAVFSTARIPLAVQLGYVLGDRSRVDLFQYDRDRGVWSWPTAAPAGPPAPVSWTLSEIPEAVAGDAAIRVSLSAPIRPHLTPRAAVEIDIGIPHPSVYWLRDPGQLAGLARVYAEALAAIRARPGIRRIHLYYAGPAPGAVAFGRAYNPNMNPPLVVYDYCHTHYEPALTLNRRRRAR